MTASKECNVRVYSVIPAIFILIKTGGIGLEGQIPDALRLRE